MEQLREVVARAMHENTEVDGPAGKYSDSEGFLRDIKQAGFVVVPAHASPKMAEAGLFANDDALLMSAGAGDMMNAYRAMVEASNAPT